jgi:hypothetical protein
MKAKDKEFVLDCVDTEGFEYAFVFYSEFSEIEDETFQELRGRFVDARKELAEYIGLEE